MDGMGRKLVELLEWNTGFIDKKCGFVLISARQ
jgi:hypothetical protein